MTSKNCSEKLESEFDAKRYAASPNRSWLQTLLWPHSSSFYYGKVSQE